jgi:hypothetical protein
MKKITNKTLIIGSGINNLIFPSNHFLCSWDNFTRHFFNAKSNPYAPATLLMEDCIRKVAIGTAKSKKATVIEDVILRNIASAIKNENLSKDKSEFKWILENKSITDIICLNFNFPFGIDEFEIVNNVDVKLNQIETLNNCQYWRIKGDKNCKIRFWFPHGNILCPDRMVFGTFRYKSQTSYLGELFVKLKTSETNYFSDKDFKEKKINQKHLLDYQSKQKGFSWLSPFFYNELYFLGTSISPDEWAIWSAITLRFRNFSKKENRKYENSIYHMRSGKDAEKGYPHFIQPLYSPTLSYDEQWKMLEEDFSKKNK